MQLLRNILISVLAIVAIVSLVQANEAKVPFLSGVTQGSEYKATTTPSLSAYAVLKSGVGSLGSVVVLGANTGTCAFYDATSTVTNSEWATTTLATVPASLAAGGYVFDVVFQKGLLVDCKGTQPTTTITFR